MEKDKKDVPIVYQNINDSIYVYKFENYEFYFSSQFYKRNFKLRIESYIKEETYKLKNRYHINNEEFLERFKDILIISFYKKIEKRGFRIYLNGERIKDDK